MKLAPVNWDAESLEDLYNSYMSEEDHSSWYLTNLMDIASECDTITEIGMFQGHSISAFLRTNPKKVIGYDIDISPINVNTFNRLCPKDTDLHFKQDNSLTMDVIDECDLLFIDSVHRYEHVIQELIRHGNQAQKFIVVHDTNYPTDTRVVVWHYQHDGIKSTSELAYAANLKYKKVGDAVKEFVDNSNEIWYHYKELTEQSGMMVIARSALSSAG